jgi:hypothetical protein
MSTTTDSPRTDEAMIADVERLQLSVAGSSSFGGE